MTPPSAPESGRSRSFCILPWIALDIAPNGEVFPCCFFDALRGHAAPGSLRRSSLSEIWNSEGFRSLRLAMLEGRSVPFCVRCYRLENSGCRSERMRANDAYASHLPFVSATRKDGSLDRFAPSALNIRFSNLCNYKCRYCGPERSSSWYPDALHWRGEGGPTDVPEAPLITPTDDPEKLLRQIEPLLPELRRIYFTGGEPLLTEEHRRILDRLVALKRFDIELIYSTNFSVSRYQDMDFYRVWKDFQNVHVAASLDASGRRGEYIRKNQSWMSIVENRRRMLATCPEAGFFLAPAQTICAMEQGYRS